MSDSASSLRERRVAETAQSLRAEARRLTAEQGFSGFTIEELCEHVGVSRRTFFNYYASKENAVLGIAVRTDTVELDEAFVAGTGHLLDDLAELLLARWDLFAPTRAEGAELGRVFDREPRLFAHFVALAAESERDDTALALRRPDCAGDALRAATAVHLLGALLRPTVAQYFADGDTDIHGLLRQRLTVARDLLSS
ncbi:TetR/AcrR family transcriptional regulator [Microbacterium terricola]|uniref:TetR/AcrR family transcriptional regulator n=1 Tax=Microbacterium terricola TaxID=344163 RepID=UPI0021E7539A|nr:TetR/AcrR family transcriptional regulator [Microbacterium terricola]UYK39627.1 TetR/AcrR family transcriptional regulator [Microbacterium terricola]